jgi:CMP-2-keto-3-deoxyoctulosonic acid synthetase
MNTALEQEYPELDRLLQGINNGLLTKIALEVARQALALNQCETDLIREQLDTPMLGDERIRDRLEELADNVEDPYLETLENDDDESQINPAMLNLFRQARAVNALYFALSSNPALDATNAIYEAIHSGLDLQVIRNIVKSVKS